MPVADDIMARRKRSSPVVSLDVCEVNIPRPCVMR